MVIIVYLLFVFISLISNVKKNQKFYFLMFACIFTLMYVVKDSADLSIYRWAYEEHIPHGKERIFDVLCALAWMAGIKFPLFKLLWQTATLFFVYKGFKKYSDYPAIVAALFFIGVFQNGFLTQMRSALAGAIMIYAFPYLFEGGRKNAFKYTVWLLVASCFHVECFCYIVFLVIPIIRFSTKDIFVISMMGVLAITIILLGCDDIIQSYVPSNGRIGVRVAQWLQNVYRPNLTGFMFNVSYQMCIYIPTSMACRKIGKCNANYSRKALNIQKMNNLMLLLVPFYAWYHTIRIFYIFLPVCYGAIAQYVGDMTKLMKQRVYASVMLLWIYGITIFVLCVNVYHEWQEYAHILGITS